MKLSVLLSFFFLPLLIVTPQVASQSHFFNWYCIPNYGNYTTNSTYQRNLNALFPYLIDQASVSSFGYHSKVDDGTDNEVYMLFNCRGDLNGDECHSCVQDAAQTIVKQCPEEKEANVWFEECTLRYSSRNIFSLEEESPFVWDDKGNVSNPLEFGQVLGKTIDGLIKQAAYNATTKGYAIGEANTTGIESFKTVYSLVQCTPDILGKRCERCLRAVFRSMAGCCGTNKQMMDFYVPSCHIRYSPAPFIPGTGPTPGLPVSPAPPPPANSSTPSPSTTTGTGSTVTRSRGDIFILGLILAVSMLFIAPASS